MPIHIGSDEGLEVLARIEQKVERIEKQAQSMATLREKVQEFAEHLHP